MICANCGNAFSRINYTRTLPGGIYRRRHCPKGHTTWTHEQRTEGTPPEVKAFEAARQQARRADAASRQATPAPRPVPALVVETLTQFGRS